MEIEMEPINHTNKWQISKTTNLFMFFTFFQSHKVINPQMYHGRHKREIASTHSSEEEGRHIHHLTVAWDVDGQDFVLDLKLNRDLIPEHYFEKYHHQVEKLSIICNRFR